MAKDGIYWYSDPYEVSQKFSATAVELPARLYGLAADPLMEAAHFMRERVLELDRIKSGRMLDSVGYEVNMNSKGRVQGYYGFIVAPPYWTLFQEYGTRGRHGGKDLHVNPKYGLTGETPGNGGIAPMHAFIDATALLQVRVAENISRFNIWENFR